MTGGWMIIDWDSRLEDTRGLNSWVYSYKIKKLWLFYHQYFELWKIVFLILNRSDEQSDSLRLLSLSNRYYLAVSTLDWLIVDHWFTIFFIVRWIFAPFLDVYVWIVPAAYVRQTMGKIRVKYSWEILAVLQSTNFIIKIIERIEV